MSRSNAAPTNHSADDALLVLCVLAVVVGSAFMAAWQWWPAFRAACASGLLHSAQVLSWPFAWLPFIQTQRSTMSLLLTHPTWLPQVPPLVLVSLVWWSSVPLALLVAGGCGALAWRGFNHPLLRARRRLDHQGLMDVQARNFAAIAPVIDHHQLPNDWKRWRPSYWSSEAAHALRLIDAEGRFDPTRARAWLTVQLGALHAHRPGRWRPTEKALFGLLCEAVFEANGGLANAQLLRDQLNLSARNAAHMPDLQIAEAVFIKWAKQIRTHRGLATLAARHKHTRTLLYAIALESTEQATLPDNNRGVGPAVEGEVIWLKPNDRPLFYALATTGSKTPFIESAGVFAQYQAELLAAQHGLSLPGDGVMVEAALKGWILDLQQEGLLTKTF